MHVRSLGLCWMLLACACEKAQPVDDRATKPALDAAALARHEFESTPVAAGDLSGLVVFTGVAPTRTPINTQAQGGCGFDPREPPLTETLIVENACVANVLVWLENPPAEALLDVEALPALELRQKGCVYRPHVLGLRVGQSLRITNEDGATHNVHTLSRNNSQSDFNRTQAAGAPAIEVKFSAPEVAISLVCDLHPWMKAWVGVFEHSFFAVSRADGRFRFRGMPPGTYRVRAWHEKLGRLSGEATLTAERGAALCLSFDAPR